MKTTKRLYTAKRLYFTCPIKAIYMAREFGVKFILEDEEQLRSFLGVGLSEEKETFEEKLRIKSKYFIAKESEHIFQPKEEDLDADGFSFTKVMPVVNHMTGKIDYYTDACWLVKIEEFTRSKEKSKTIFRDNKQFFMAEVENENN